MRHSHHLCFTLSVILCIRAAYGLYDNYTLKPCVRQYLKELLRGTKAWYDRRVEVKVADDISSYALHHNLKESGELSKLLRFVNDFEKAFSYKTRYFESERRLYKHVVLYEGKLGCAHLPHYLGGYVCLIEVPMLLNF